jgi:hypothetical protein
MKILGSDEMVTIADGADAPVPETPSDPSAYNGN